MSRGCPSLRSRPTACRSRSPARAEPPRAGLPSCMRGGSGCSTASSRRASTALGGTSPRRSGRRSAPAATRSASEVADAVPPRASAPGSSCAAGSSTSGRRQNERCGRPASRRSSGSTSAPRATPSCSSRIGATGSRRGVQGVIARCRADEVRAALRARSAAEVGDAVSRSSRRRSTSPSRSWRSSPRPGSRSSARTARAGSRGQSTPVYGDAFRWHFIGHLQSRKARGRERDLRARPLALVGVCRASASRSRRWSRSTSPARRRSPGVARASSMG